MGAWRLLVVDDHRGVRQMVMTLAAADDRFEPAGEAEDGAAAIAAVRDSCPDVIVLDQQMPVLDGLSALPQLRAVCPRAVIVLHSSDETVRDAALAAGADLYVPKGSPISDLFDAAADIAANRT